jgi:hypothetical protein
VIAFRPHAGLLAIFAVILPQVAVAERPVEELINVGSLVLTGGVGTESRAIRNDGIIEVAYDVVLFEEAVSNRGTMKITESVVRFAKTYEEYGAYVSDPSDNYFTDLIVGTTGYLVGGVGDDFHVAGDFISSSTQNVNWYTRDSYLEFQAAAGIQHDFYITGQDVGASDSGYTNNFAWGTLELGAGNSIALVDGNAETGGALYVTEMLGVVISGTVVANVSGTDEVNIYYDPQPEANAYLSGRAFNLGGTGHLIPVLRGHLVPTMSAYMLAGLALLLMALGGAVIRWRAQYRAS